MMLHTINNINFNNEDKENICSAQESYVCFYSLETFIVNALNLGVSKEQVSLLTDNRLASFEYNEKASLITLQIPHEVNSKESFSRVFIYIRKNILVFVCKKHKIIEELIREIDTTELKNENIEKILYLFINRLVSDDLPVLEKIEREIMDIEEQLILSQKYDNYVKKIFNLRKKLIVLKKYYNQLTDILEGLTENENDLFENSAIRLFDQLSARINRLYDFVMNLREYVTEIREAYQVQMDIRLNSIMKLFTVLTAIFLPLTLIVGWYGMNLKMPEFHWDNGYLFVIVLSVIIVTGEIIYFKKNKWF